MVPLMAPHAVATASLQVRPHGHRRPKWRWLRRPLRGFCAEVLWCWACSLVTAVAFDIDAHDAIGQTAASAMDQQAIKQVKRLLGGQDASDVAGWGHQVDDTFPGMARLHFQVHVDTGSQPFCGPVGDRVARCEDNICLLMAIKHFYGKVLQDEGRAMDYPAIDYSKVEKAIKFTDADAVKMLINLVGDMHQPMHVGYASDDNGHAVQVTFRGQTMSLYDFWDKGISELVRKHESGFWLGGWTHVRAISQEFEKDKEMWKKDGAFKTFDAWMAESVQFACNKAYVHPITGARIGRPGAGQHPVQLDEAGYQVWKEAWLRQLLVAGERTAIVLNDILDAGGAAKLHQGSSVKTKADEEKARQQLEWAKEREHAQRAERAAKGFLPKFDMSVLCTNLAIAVVVVPLFLAFVNHGLNPNVYISLIMNLLEPAGSSSSSAGGAASGALQGRATKRWE